MTNAAIADVFSLLSKLMDIHGENSFKAKSYSIAAFTIDKLPNEVAMMEDAELYNIRGIGDAAGKKIRELQEHGALAQLEDILQRTPAGILEMLHIKGLGPKKIAVVWKEMGIEDIGELEYACNENRLVAYKGFGAKTQENILQSITYYKQSLGFHLWRDANAVAMSVLEHLINAYPAYRFAITGALRRQDEIIEYIELITDAPKALMVQQFEAIPDAMVTEEHEDCILIDFPAHPKIKFHFSAKDTYYHGLFHTTGSEEFIASFAGSHELPETAASEEAIFEHNKLQYIPPALREEGAMLKNAAGNMLPQLITERDIKGIIHTHSKWSDGGQTIEHMAKAARDSGYEYLVISDHSQTASYAGGLSPERIAAQHQEIDALNAKLAPFRIFKSIESDILGDGSLDYTDKVLQTFDLVIASVHSNLQMSAEKATERVLRAVQNPFTTILGHATGRLLLSRKGYPLDHKKIIDACAEHNVVVEINANPHRLDIDWRWIPYALEKGVLLSIDPDAHSVNGYNDIYYGVMAAQKGGLTPAHNLSSFTLAQFEDLLVGYHKKRAGVAQYG